MAQHPTAAPIKARSTSRTTRRHQLGAVLCGLALLGGAVSYGAVRYGLATIPPLALPAPDAISKIVVDRDGLLLRAYTTRDGRWRLPVRVEDVSELYLKMLLAFEDRRFHQHGGVDLRAMVRAVVQRVSAGRVISGGSTLTMQTARLISGTHDRTLRGKFRQMVQAVHLEGQLTKREILQQYLTLAPFGGNIEGVRAASLSYFGREPKHLSVAEAALLVALPQSPEARRPDRAPALARKARNHVIQIAVRRGVISAAEGRRATLRPVPTRRRPFPMLAPHLADEKIAASIARVSKAEAEAEARTEQQQQNVKRVFRTTIRRSLQAQLQVLAKSGAERNGPQLSVAILVADHSTGAVLARIGSAGFLDRSRLGAIDMTRAIRSPGSTLKPLIYGLGFDRGMIHPETLIEDLPTRFGSYAPRNFSEDYRGTVTIREALAASLNVPAVKVLDAISPGHLVGRLTRFGITSHLPHGVRPNLAVALGGVGLDLHDLVQIFGSLARGGRHFVFSDDPDTVARNLHAGSRQHASAGLVSPKASRFITDILKNAPPPPNARAGQIAFKTGTSYGHRDAWAIGYDGRHVIGVWIGRADATATPELLGRMAAAPILFDAFKAVSPRRAAFPPGPRDARVVAGAELPPPLRRFDSGAGHTTTAGFINPPVRILFPPDRSDVAATPDGNGQTTLVLRVEGGALPLTWLADGNPIAQQTNQRATFYRNAPQSGFVRLTVIDALGRTARSTVRIVE